MTVSEILVTVVIAAYNAEDTINATLISAREQTHRRMEIIVVVDGATDGTEAIVQRHAQQDDRLIVIVTPNRGFCAARNTAAQAGGGAFIAPLDADDVWHPRKIEKQLQVFETGGDQLGMVYTLYRRIDQWGYLILDGAYACWAGQIFNASLLYNCVGTGSSMMIRSSVFDAVGGYAMDLNRLGCEDYLLQILISHDWSIDAVPEFLTGYRYVPGSMSRDHVRMAEARLKMMKIVHQRHPDMAEDVKRFAFAQVTAELALAHARAGIFVPACAEIAKATRISAWFTGSYILYRLRGFGFNFLRRVSVRLRREKPPQFQHIDPLTRYGIAKKPRKSRTIRRVLRQNAPAPMER